MAIFLSLVSKLFGNKYDKDIKSIEPIIKQIHLEHEKIIAISNDELREKTTYLKAKIEKSICQEKEKISSLKNKAEQKGVDKDEKEEIYNEIDEIEKSVIKIIEVTQNEILPVAFAVIKETATRFKNNATIKVTANDVDRDLAANKDFVSIEGAYAIYKNSWIAAGNEITWDMIHYDVQLVGGVVL
ncbi:MAG TPA: preprotein translocase subunit SecA, partial [Flavobacteriales bacterium]|nr:preprotein translocase subunit SecA [Flavobacteriales bacterium]